MQLLQCFKTKKLKRNATSKIAEVAEVALSLPILSLPTAAFNANMVNTCVIVDRKTG